MAIGDHVWLIDVPPPDAVRRPTIPHWGSYRHGRWVLWCTNPPNPIPSFDNVLAVASKPGRILGVKLKNPGYGISIDDIVSEHSYTQGRIEWE